MFYNNKSSFFPLNCLRVRVINEADKKDYNTAVDYCQYMYEHKLKAKKIISKKSCYIILEELNHNGYEIISCMGIVFPDNDGKHFSEKYLPYNIEKYMDITCPKKIFNKQKLIEFSGLCSSGGDLILRILLTCSPIIAFKLGYSHALVTITDMIQNMVTSKCLWDLNPLVFSNANYANINKEEWGKYYDFKPITGIVDLELSYIRACSDDKDFIIKKCVGVCHSAMQNYKKYA